MDRETMLARTFVDLAAALIRDCDTIDLLHTLTERSATLLRADASSLLLADRRGELPGRAEQQSAHRRVGRGNGPHGATVMALGARS